MHVLLYAGNLSLLMIKQALKQVQFMSESHHTEALASRQHRLMQALCKAEWLA